MPSVTVVLPWCCPVAATMTALRLMSCRVGEGKRGSEHARWHPRDAAHRSPIRAAADVLPPSTCPARPLCARPGHISRSISRLRACTAAAVSAFAASLVAVGLQANRCRADKPIYYTFFLLQDIQEVKFCLVF
jgi:hypothetical protein